MRPVVIRGSPSSFTEAWQRDLPSAFAPRNDPGAVAFAAWHTAPGITFGSAVGDSVTWGPSEGPLYVGVLLGYEPGVGFEHTLSFTFVDPVEESVVLWDVVRRGEVVHVRVRHDCTGAPGTERVITDVGWAKSLARLKTLLETGTAMPWPEDGGSP